MTPIETEVREIAAGLLDTYLSLSQADALQIAVGIQRNQLIAAAGNAGTTEKE